MPLPLVVVEVPTQDRAASETSALIEACTKGLGGGRCELTQARNPESVSAIAIVSWRDDERLGALVEVSRVRQPSESWRSEELRFKPEDLRVERFRTLGLAIATLFREAALQPPNDAAGEAEPVAPPKKKPTRDGASGDSEALSNGEKRRSVRYSPEAWISAGAFAAYDSELAAWRTGALLKVSVGAARFPVFLSALGSYAVGPDLAGVSLSWSTLGLGPGLRLPLAPSFELRGVARGLVVDVSGRISEAGVSSRQNVWVPGAGFELELALRAGDRLSATFGTGLQHLAGNVPIREHNKLVGTASQTALVVTLTLELWLFGAGTTADKMPE